MAHLHRFYVSPETIGESVITLEPSEAHHALHVCRLKPGAPVSVFDGRGNLAEGEITQADKKGVRLDVTLRDHQDRPQAPLAILQASLQGSPALEYIVTRCTELAVDRLILFRADRSERSPMWPPRLHKTAIEAAKQCHNPWLPSLETAASLFEAIQLARADTLLAATLDTEPKPLRLVDTSLSTAIAIGPEGDFTSREMALLSEHRAIPLSLGKTTFRAEVAATLAATLVQYERALLGPLPEDSTRLRRSS
jgi:16S rRNA (uracil1498-N3)-methyltransferase